MNDTQTIEILKSLRLHAMASVYEASLRLAPGAAPSTDALLAEMAEAEQSARRLRATERLLKRAAIRIPASLDEITFSPERNLDRDLVSRLSSMRWVAEGASVLVTGPYASILPHLLLRDRVIHTAASMEVTCGSG